jgi:hypothetical protein
MLRNPIYIGTRAWGRSEARTVGSTKRIKHERTQWIFSDRDEALRLVDDQTFHGAQDMLDQITEQVRKRQTGGPLNAELFFHRSRVLRCAICGGRFTLVKRNRKDALGGVGYQYVCASNRATGGPRCQSHDARSIDAAVRDELAQAFAGVTVYICALEDEIEKTTAGREQRTRQRRLAAHEAALDAHQANYLNCPGDAPQSVRGSLYTQVLKQARAVEELRREILQFAESEASKRQRESLVLLQCMEAFSWSPYAAQRELIDRVVAAVWLWPDRRFVVQRTAQSEQDVERLANAAFEPAGAAFPNLEYRQLRIARQWDSVDFVRVSEQALTMVRRGEIPSEVFRRAGMAAKPINRLYRDGDTTGFGPLTALKMYMIAKQEYFDIRRLRADIAAWLLKKTESEALATVARRIHVSPRTMAKMLHGAPIRRPTYSKFVTNVGWSLDGYRALPEGFVEISKLREMVYWVVCAGSPSMFRRLTLECGLHCKAGGAMRERGVDVEVCTNRHPLHTDDSRSDMNGLVEHTSSPDRTAVPEWSFDEIQELVPASSR